MNGHRLVTEPLADLDIEAAFEWYEAQRSGLGIELLDELRSWAGAEEARMGGLAPHVRAAIAAAMQPRMAEAQRVGARPGPPRGQSVGLQAKPATRILPPTALRWHANLHPNAVQLAQEQEEPEIVQYVEVASTNPSHPFDCAEPHAVATLASLGVALENICVRGISTVPTNKAEQGETRTPCKNCSEWLELVVDGVYRIKPAKLKASWRSGYRIGMGRISGQHLAYQLGLD